MNVRGEKRPHVESAECWHEDLEDRDEDQDDQEEDHMTWNYRVVRRLEPHGKTYGIHEVFYDDAGKAFACTENPGRIGGFESEWDVIVTLRQMLKNALHLPALDYDKIPEDGAVNPGAKETP